MGALVDNFVGPELDTALWNAVNSPGNSGDQEGGRYTFIVAAGATGDASIVSDVAYNLTGSHIHIHLLSAGVQEAGLEMYPLILTQNPANQNNALLIVVSNGLVGLYEFVAGVPNGLAFPAYNPVTMAWWRIREAGGTVFFESAPDVQGPWTQRASVVPTIAITALYAKVRTFDFLALATAKSTAITDINYLAPPDLEFPNGTFPVGMEMAFGVDPSTDIWGWDWTDVTPDFLAQSFAIRRGRSDEQSHASATETSYTLDNPEGHYTPDDARSPYWPNIDLGTPGRLWLNVSTPRLGLHPSLGSNAQVASIAALNLTNDLDVRIDLHLKTMDPDGANAVIVGRGAEAGPFSWRVEVLPDHRVTLLWSDDGTPPFSQLTSTVPVLPMSARSTLRVTLDVNNGAAGHDVRFYLGDSVGGTFSQVGPTVTGSGTTSIFTATEPLVIGSQSDLPVASAIDADVYAFQLRNGIAGSVIVDADFTAQVSGVTAFVDSTGLLWTVNGSGELSNRWYRITGTNDEWEPNWPWGDLSDQQDGGLGEGEARVDITLSGVIRRITQGESPLQAPLNRAISAQSTIQSYHPLDDEDGANSLASGLPGGSPASWIGTIELSSYEGLPGSKPVLTMQPDTQLTGPIVGTFTGQWQMDWYVNVPSPGPVTAVTIMTVTGGPGATVALWVVTLTSSALTVSGRDGTGTVITTNTGSPSGFFGGPQHVRLMAMQNGSDIDWQIVWFPVVIPPTSGFFLGNTVAGSVGGIIGWSVPPNVLADGISIGQVSSFDAYDLDSDDEAAIGWAGDTAVQRMARLCTEQSVPFRVIGASETSERMGVQGVDTFSELLYEAADADGGLLYDMPDGLGLIYRTRESLYNQPPNMVLDGLQSQFANPLRPIKDDARLRNDITVSRQDGSSFQAVDQASVDKNGRYDEAITLNLYADSQNSGAAGWRLHAGTWPGMRYPVATTNLGVAPEVIDSWLTADPGSRVELTNLPPQHPTSGIELMIEGYQEPIDPENWAPQMACSPAGVWDVAELDGPWVPAEYLLRLDTDGSELTLPIDDNDTVMFVTVTAGPYWTSDNAETPFDVNVGGERMTVTDVAPTTGGTQFTGAGAAQDVTPATAFVAPSVVAPAVGDLLIAAWCSYSLTGTYTLPGGMTIAAATSGTFSTMEDATQVLAGAGATGTRTATFSTSDTWSAVNLVAHAASGTPGVQEFLSAVDTSPSGAALPVTITTILPADPGDWLLAIQAWDWDPGNNMVAPSGDGWMPVADSVLANLDTSRVRAWARRVTYSGVQSATFSTVAGINDNHARLYVLTGITGITQQFTVIRSVNDVVKSHDLGTDVRLWFPPVLAR